jgi:general secretion pathway protein L
LGGFHNWHKAQALKAISQAINGIGWFFRWWFGQLANFVPASMRLFFRSRADTLVIDVSGSEVVLLRCTDQACEEIGRYPAITAPGTGPEDVAAQIKAALASAGAQRTALRLSAGQALRRPITLPAAAEGDLRDILSHQIEQVTPFQAREAYFGYRVTGNDQTGGRIEVELTVAPKRYVDAALNAAAGWGLTPDIVDITSSDTMATPEINLIAGNGTTGKSNPWPRINGGLFALAACLVLAAILIPLENARTRADGLLAQTSQLRRASKEVLDLRAQRDDLVKRVRFIAGQKQDQPYILDILNELTRILPKDTWLYEIRINRPEVRISGYSPSASSLIGKINDSPIFRNPRFRSPVTRPANTDKERFNLSFESGPPTKPGAK